MVANNFGPMLFFGVVLGLILVISAEMIDLQKKIAEIDRQLAEHQHHGCRSQLS